MRADNEGAARARSRTQRIRVPAENLPDAARGAFSRILVVGTTIAETVEHTPGRGERRGLGGVGATIALALGEAGNDVTLLTQVGRGGEGDEARRLLAEAPVNVIIRESRGAAGHAVIQTEGGEPRRVNGRWPRAEGISEMIDREAARHDVIITDTHMLPADITRALDRPGKLTMVNATTRGVARIPRRRRHPLGMLTLNQREADALMEQLNCTDARQMMLRLKADRMLLTRDRRGWSLHQQDGKRTESPAVAVPDHTDFVGCGDYAAAGAVHAVLHQLDPRKTVNEFITRKLEINVVQPC